MADPILGNQQFIPNELTPNYRTRFYRDPVSGTMSIQYTVNGGISWSQFISQPPANAGADSIPALDGHGNIVWKPFSSFSQSAAPTTPGTATQKWTDFSFPAVLFTSNQFGYFKVPSNTTLSCYGAQLSIFTPAAGADVVVYLVQIVNSIPRIQTTNMRLTQGSLFANVTFSQAVTMSPNTEWALTLSSTGTTEPGEFLSCRLLFNAS